MKIALFGYGKMGKCIEQMCLPGNHEVVCRIGRASPKLVEDAQVCIDFSHPDAVLENVHFIATMGKPLVIGTTGWSSHLPEVEAAVQNAGTGLIWAPNFSLGVHLFLQIISEAAKLIDHFDHYDISGHESHHNQKADSPSGTAKAISERLLRNIDRKKTIVYDTLNRPIESGEIHFTSTRAGFDPGTHTVAFDSPEDTIRLSHQARNREGFARGALLAAEWILDKKGVYTIDDLIQTLTSEKKSC